jgi:magnesium-transporting ATPase (P-type)
MTDNKPDEIKKPKSWIYLLGQGIIAGIISILLGLVLYQLFLGGLELMLPNFLFDLLIAAIIGLPSGGIGGLLVGSIWRHPRASIVGGIIFAFILLCIVLVVASIFII